MVGLSVLLFGTGNSVVVVVVVRRRAVMAQDWNGAMLRTESKALVFV